MVNTILSEFEKRKLGNICLLFKNGRNEYLMEIVDLKQLGNKYALIVDIHILSTVSTSSDAMNTRMIILDYDISNSDFLKWLESVESFSIEKLECHDKPSWQTKKAI